MLLERGMQIVEEHVADSAVESADAGARSTRPAAAKHKTDAELQRKCGYLGGEVSLTAVPSTISCTWLRLALVATPGLSRCSWPAAPHAAPVLLLHHIAPDLLCAPVSALVCVNHGVIADVSTCEVH